MFNLKAIYQGLYRGKHAQSVCEVGVNQPDLCSVTDFYHDGASTILVEPLPWLAKSLRMIFPDAMVHEKVCGDRNGMVKLYDRGEGSWIEQVPIGKAPDEHEKHSGIKREEFDPQFVREVESVTFDRIDPGDLDVLCVDTEGAEWFVIERMVSVPKLVRLETHFSCSGWINPFDAQIRLCMKNKGYTLLAEDVSDTLWVLL